jgi:hypothetical protein
MAKTDKVDMSRADRFVWQDGDVVITPPPPGDNTAELYKDVDWAALERQAEGDDTEEEGKHTPDLGELAKRFDDFAKKS